MHAKRRSWRLGFALSVPLTLAPLRRGRGDPTTRVDAHEMWRATRTPEGPATMHLTVVQDEVVVSAWGDGAEWVLESVPALIGSGDDPASFNPAHPVLRALERSLVGLRIGRTDAVIEALVPSILEQKVPGLEARRSYRKLVLAWGERAPGPSDLFLPPCPETLADQPYWAFHRLGIERRRADVIRGVCGRARRIEEASRLSEHDRDLRLTAFRGIGPWTAAEVSARAFGDPDAVPLGDYHIPHMVTWVLDGKPRGDDQKMLELLEPYRGHRGRVIRLLKAGAGYAPRFAPRARLRSIASI